MKQKIVTLGIISLFVMTSFAALPCIGATITSYKLNETVESDKDTLCTDIGVANNDPPLPPLMWTEDFTTFYILFVDPEGDDIWILIDWGDGTHGEWIGPYKSGEIVSISHVWWDEGTYQIKLKARDSWGEGQEAVYSLTLSPDFKFFHPSLGYIGITYKFTIYLEDYGLFIFAWGDGTYSDWVTGIACKSWSSLGDYKIRWKAKDIYGHETPWSDPILVTILKIGNNPPRKPDIAGPTRGKVGVEYEFTFVTTDPDGDNVSYYINWGDGSPAVEWIGPHKSGEEVTVSHMWDHIGCYLIRCRAKDTHGAESDWTVGTFIVEKNKPVIQNTKFLQLFERFMNCFPLLQRLFNLR